MASALARALLLLVAALLLALAAALPAAADDAPSRHSRGQIAEAMRRAGFPEHEIAVGVAIVLAESSGRADATNDGSATKSAEYSVGPWQINLRAHGSRITEATARDLQAATNYAFQLWRASGWNPWGAYTDGSYLRHLEGLPPGASDASGRGSGAPGRPAPTQLLPTHLPIAEARPQLIVLVGGLGSAADGREFDRLLEPFSDDPRYEIVRFGASAGHPFDPTGSLETNGRSLANYVRAVAAGYDGVHVVAHSMGGAVADRAFAHGLSAEDGVRTYTALAAPHDGATAAMLARRTLEFAGEDAAGLRALSRLAHDIGSPAVTELAGLRAAAPPAEVARLNIRMATDQVVLAPDARSPGVDSRVLLPDSFRDLEGHGAVLSDTRAAELVRGTITQGRPPADTRGRELQAAAAVADHLMSGLVFAGLLVLGGLTVLALERLQAARRPHPFRFRRR
jgi:hypothetical protein